MDANQPSAPISLTTAVAARPPSAPRQAPATLSEASSRALADITLAWPRSAQWAAVALLGLASLLLLVHAVTFLPFGARPVELQRGESLTIRLDLNRATRAELLQLPGVGPKLAESILAYREKHGRFHRVADLDKVNGIGTMILKRLEPWVCVDGESDAGGEPPARKEQNRMVAERPRPAHIPLQPPIQRAALQKGELINLNTASAEELQRLPRIGPKLSQRIIEERQVSPFISIDDLQRVHGIGAKTVENLRPFVTVR